MPAATTRDTTAGLVFELLMITPEMAEESEIKMIDGLTNWCSRRRLSLPKEAMDYALQGLTTLDEVAVLLNRLRNLKTLFDPGSMAEGA